jgi:hypothetical protein
MAKPRLRPTRNTAGLGRPTVSSAFRSQSRAGVCQNADYRAASLVSRRRGIDGQLCPVDKHPFCGAAPRTK